MNTQEFEPGDLVETEDGLRLYIAQPKTDGLYSLTAKVERVNEPKPAPAPTNDMPTTFLHYVDLGRWRGSVEHGYTADSLKLIRKPTDDEVSSFNYHRQFN